MKKIEKNKNNTTIKLRTRVHILSKEMLKKQQHLTKKINPIELENEKKKRVKKKTQLSVRNKLYVLLVCEKMKSIKMMMHLRDDETIILVSHHDMGGPSKRRTTLPWSCGSCCGLQMQQSPPASKASEIGLMTRMPSPVVAQEKAPRKATREMMP